MVCKLSITLVLGKVSRSHDDNIATNSRSVRDKSHDRIATSWRQPHALFATFPIMVKSLRPRVAELEIGAVIKAARDSSARSPLYIWLHDRHDMLLPELSRYGVNWQALADQFAAAGIQAGRGCVPTSKSVRQTWHRVRRDRPTEAPLPAKPGFDRSAVFDEPGTEDAPRKTFRHATLIGMESPGRKIQGSN